MLPTKTVLTDSSWLNFEQAKYAFDEVIVGKTTVKQMHEMGFDPFKTPNISIENYLSIQDRFDPFRKGVSLPEIVRECIVLQEKCYALSVKAGIVKDERIGNAFLDVTTFRRQTFSRRWIFEAVFIVKSDLIVYKLWKGSPMLETYEDDVRPLGPVQNIGDFLTVLPI